MDRRKPVFLFCLLAFLVLAPLSSSGYVYGTEVSDGVAAAQTTVPDEPHRKPDEVTGTNISQLSTWLSRRMGERLSHAVSDLDRSQFDAAKKQLDREYGSLLDRFSRVTDRTTSGKDELTIDEFREAQEEARKLTEEVEKHRQIIKDAANSTETENGNVEELVNTTIQVNKTSRNLTRLTKNLSKNTSTNYNETVEELGNVTNETESLTRKVTSSRSSDTEIHLSIAGGRVNSTTPVSFVNSLTVYGNVSSNGTDPDGKAVLVTTPRDGVRDVAGIDERDLRKKETRVKDGKFNLSYKPVVEEVGIQTWRVEFKPENPYLYNRSNRTFEVDVSAVEPDIDVTKHPKDSMRYGNQYEVSGDIHVDGEAVEGYPLNISISGHRLSTAVTEESGRFSFSGSIISEIPSGPGVLEVSSVYTSHAVGSVSAGTKVNVSETETKIVASTDLRKDLIVINGGLYADLNVTSQKDKNIPVPDQKIQVLVESNKVTETRTSHVGEYGVEVRLEDNVIPNSEESLNVTVVYDGGGNLKSSSASSSVSVNKSRIPIQWILLVAMASVGVMYFRRPILERISGIEGPTDIEKNIEEDSEKSAAELEDTEEASSERGEEKSDNEEGSGAVGLAEDRHASGRWRNSVSLCYRHIRDGFQEKHDITGSYTHRELYRELEEELSNDRSSWFYQLTMLYEKSEFSSMKVTEEDSERAIDLARKLEK